MKKEQLVRSVIGCIIILALGFVTYTLMKHSEQTEPTTQNESLYENEVTGKGGWEVESTVATETLRTGDGVTHTDAQGVPDLSKVKNTNDSPVSGELSADAYRTFQNSHVPYSRSIVDVLPLTDTPAYKLEHKWSDLADEDFKKFDPYESGCWLDRSNTIITLTKFDAVSKEYIPIVDDVCIFVDYTWYFASGMDLSNPFYPVWSRDKRYVAFIDKESYRYDIFNPETAQRFIFMDTMNLQAGLQEMSLPGVTTSNGPTLALDPSTVRKTKEGHIQMIGIGEWRPPQETYVYVFDFTDWSLKQILDINPDKDFLIGRAWAGESAVRVYTVSTDAVKKCQNEVGRGSKMPWLSPLYDDCHKMNFSNFAQMKTHTISF